MAEGTVEERKPARGGPKGDVHIVVARCKGCGFCVEFCPTHVLEMSHDYNPKGYHFPLAVRPEACSGCDLCGMYCPDFAIFGVRRKKGQ
jgi:2-oxoglutarate ferredoxin oxidoreductase subunit delta